MIAKLTDLLSRIKGTRYGRIGWSAPVARYSAPISQDNQVTWFSYAMLTEVEMGLPSQTDHRFHDHIGDS